MLPGLSLLCARRPGGGRPWEPGWPQGSPCCLQQSSCFSALCPLCDTSITSLCSSNLACLISKAAQCLLLLWSTRKEMQEGPWCSIGDFDATEKAFGYKTNSSEMYRSRRSCGRAFQIRRALLAFVSLPRLWLKAFLRQIVTELQINVYVQLHYLT